MIDFKHKSCSLDIGTLCTLECPQCMRADWSDKKQIPGSNMTIEQFTKIVNYFQYIHFCGQISDPIFNPNLITFLFMCKIYYYIAMKRSPNTVFKLCLYSNPILALLT